MTAGLYVHIPFCISRCHYCDFYSCTDICQKADAYIDALEREIIQRAGEHSWQNCNFDTIYFGGGNPTALDGAQLRRLTHLLKNNFTVTDTAEFTCEANPETLTEPQLQALHEAGVNRLSIGIQSWDEKELALLDRRTTPAAAASRIEAARTAGFNNINLDIIFALPGQTPGKWNETLERTLSFNPQHISAYGLSIPEGTPLHARLTKGEIQPADEETARTMYLETVRRLADAGIRQYEISNFAKVGCACRHNLHYWNFDSYLGLGPAAASFNADTNSRETVHPDLDRYIDAAHGTAFADCRSTEQLDTATRAKEYFMLAMRTVRGINNEEFIKQYGIDLLSTWIAYDEYLVNDGLVSIDNGRIAFTPEGFCISDGLISKGFEIIENYSMS